MKATIEIQGRIYLLPHINSISEIFKSDSSDYPVYYFKVYFRGGDEVSCSFTSEEPSDGLQKAETARERLRKAVDRYYNWSS